MRRMTRNATVRHHSAPTSELVAPVMARPRPPALGRDSTCAGPCRSPPARRPGSPGRRCSGPRPRRRPSGRCRTWVRQNVTGPLTMPTITATTASGGILPGRCRPRTWKFLHGPHNVLPCSSTTQLGQNDSLHSAQVFSVATSSWLRQKPGRRRRKTLARRRRRRSPAEASSGGGGRRRPAAVVPFVVVVGTAAAAGAGRPARRLRRRLGRRRGALPRHRVALAAVAEDQRAGRGCPPGRVSCRTSCR